MATTTGAVRYSTGENEIGDAKDFPWEFPVPVNKFWDPLHWKVGSSFLSVFRADQREKLPIDPDSAEPVKDKLALLLKLLRQKLDDEDAANAPRTFYDVDYEAWDDVWRAINTIQREMGDPEEEQTLRMLVDRRQDKKDLSLLHSLSALLLEKGKYAEAEANEVPVRDWLDSLRGRHCPQAISARRIIAESVWRQGVDRREEAAKLFSELEGHLEAMRGTEYEVYQDEYKEIVRDCLRALKEETKTGPVVA